MYTCESCSKEYTSQKRYLSHIDRCQPDDTRSVRSSRSLIISDIEDDRSRSRSRSQKTIEGSGSRMRDTVEKLMKDKAKLKGEIKKYATDIRSRVDEHRDELERSQEYFQEQIDVLTEERDELLEQVSLSQESSFQEKERLRSEFTKKLTIEKKRLESRYGGKNTTQMTRLTATVEKLQDSLNHQLLEKDQLRETYESQLIEKEDMYRRQLDDLTEQLRETKSSIDAERTDIRRLVITYNDEKETFKRNCNRDKERELEQVLIDKRMAVQAVEQLKADLEKKILLMTKDREDALIQLKTEHEHALRERNELISRLKDTHARKIENDHNMLTGKIDNALRQHAIDKEKYVKEMEDRIKGIELTNARVFESARAESLQQIQDLGNELGIEKQRTATVQRQGEDAVKAKEKELRTFYEEKLKDQNEQMQKNEHTFVKAMETTISEKDKIITDMEVMNHNLGTQTSHYRSAMNRMKEDTDNIKSQFVQSLNKQKDESALALKERERRIIEIENEAKAIHNECSNKLTQAKSVLEETTKALEVSKQQELLKQNQINDLQLNYERVEFQRDSVAQNYEQRIERLKQDFTNKINKIREEAEKELKTRIDVLQAQVDSSNNISETLKHDFTNKLKEQRKQIREEVKKEKELIQAAVTEKDQELVLVREDINRMKVDFLNQINVVSQERDKAILELTIVKKNIEEVDKYKARVDILKRDATNVRRDFSDKLNTQFKELNGKLTVTSEQLASKKAEIDKLTQVIHLMRQDFTSQLQTAATIEPPERAELHKIKEELSERTLQLEKLKKHFLDIDQALKDTRNEWRSEKNRLSEKERTLEEEKKKLAESATNPVRNHEVEEKLKKMRDDCLNALRQQKLELNQVKDENLQMQQKLNSAESIIQSKNVEMEKFAEAQTELKESFVNNLNKQKTDKEKAIAEKQNIIDRRERRISELENLMTGAMKKMTES